MGEESHGIIIIAAEERVCDHSMRQLLTKCDAFKSLIKGVKIYLQLYVSSRMGVFSRCV